MGTEQSKPRTSSCKSINYGRTSLFMVSSDVEIINGSILFTNGDKYVGDVLDGQLNGNGTYYYNNNDVYKGEWRWNRKHGFGIQTYARENRKYVGFWQDNLPHGEGALYNSDGSYFEGHFLEGEKHGNGVFHDAQNDAYEEDWVNGDLVGRAPLSPSKLKTTSTPNNLTFSKRESKENNSKTNLGIHETSLKSLAKSDASDHKFESSEGHHDHEKYQDKNLGSNILFKSFNEFDSSDGKTYDVGLETLNIIEHIEMLNSVAGNLLNKDVQDWSYQEVSDWLKHLGLTDYIEIFKQNHIDGQVLFDITEADLKDEFGMTSVGHRKNFMKAIDNLKKIFNSDTGKNSDYIQHKIQRFYERNRPNNGRPMFSNNLRHPQPTRFYSSRVAKNLYSSQQDIIDEGDEDNSRSDMKPSPPMYGRKGLADAPDDFGLPENIKPGSPKPKKLDHDADDESHIKSLEERDDILRHSDLPIKAHLSKKTLSKMSSDSQKSSPMRDDHVGVKQDFQVIEEFKSSHSKKNDKESTGSHEGSSSDSTSSSESEDEKGNKEGEEKPKEDVDNLRPIKRNSKNDKRGAKKPNMQNFKSAELPIILRPSPKKSTVENKNGARRRHNRGDVDKETLNEKIKDEILRIFKDSGLNENFIIDYNELSFGKKIGEGGYGRVFLGKFSGIEVAIKEYGKTRLDVRRAEDFVKEVEVISNLRHPNIVLCMGACIHNGKYLMITEYLEEGSLFDHLHEKHTKLSDETMLAIIEDIALGMCYLHGRKVFHCDLKSSNILIDSSWEVKLCDFGLSRVKYKSDRKRFQKQRVGTPHWMAPEILRGEKYDEAADVYSFGMILWELITGEIPYHKVPISDIIATVGYEGKQINMPTKGNPLIVSIMKSCLSLDKTARPTFKQIVDGLQQRNKGASSTNKKNNMFSFFGPN